MRSLSLLMLAWAVTLLPVHAQAVNHAVPLTAQVTITVTAGRQISIVADYRLSRPVRKLEFSRTAKGLRSRMWTVLTAGMQLDSDDAVTSVNGRAFDHFRLAVKPHTDFINLNYTPVNTFSGHGFSLFTGYYNIAGAAVQTVFHFQSNQPVIVYGKPVKPDQAFSPPGDGMFVYFGTLRPVVTNDSILLLDPGLPAWISKTLQQEIPVIIRYYTAQYGMQLPARVFVLFSWKNQHASDDTDDKGGALAGNISFVLSGQGWRIDSARTRGILARLIAHELAHQWNAYLFSPDNLPSDGSSWIDEGQAEFSAIETARHFGWLGTQDALQDYTADVNDCLQAPDNKPFDKQTFNNNVLYGCGVSIELLAQAALQRHVPPYSFFDLWRHIYEQAAENGHVYTSRMFVNALVALSGDPKLGELVDRLAVHTAKNKNVQLIQAMRQLGIGFSPVTSASHNASDGRTAMRPVFAALMRADCHGLVSFYTLDNGFRVDLLKGCKTLTAPYFITAVEGQPLFTHGVKAYQAVKAACRYGQYVLISVKGRDTPIRLVCPAEIPPMPPMVDIHNLSWWRSFHGNGAELSGGKD